MGDSDDESGQSQVTLDKVTTSLTLKKSLLISRGDEKEISLQSQVILEGAEGAGPIKGGEQEWPRGGILTARLSRKKNNSLERES